MSKIKLIIGLVLILAAVGIAFVFGPTQKSSTIKILYGSEKKGLLGDAEIQKILQKKYKLTIEGTSMGSLEIANSNVDGVDGIWPSSKLAENMFKATHQGVDYKSENIFNTPIIFYSWPEITEALIKEKIVEKRDNLYFVIDTKRYLQMVVDGKTWKSIGIEKQNGQMNIYSTDPTRSNSGFLVAGLMAVILNDGNMPDETSLSETLPKIVHIFRKQGFLENSTSYLFDKYLNQGQGAFPLIASYENLIIEFYQAYPKHQDYIRKMTRVLIPEPTVWSEHPFIAITKNGQILLSALQDPEIQDIAWKRFGFRSGAMGVNNDPGILKEVGLPEHISSVIPLPSPKMMDKIVEALK